VKRLALVLVSVAMLSVRAAFGRNVAARRALVGWSILRDQGDVDPPQRHVRRDGADWLLPSGVSRFSEANLK
jgi:hypothetical protein